MEKYSLRNYNFILIICILILNVTGILCIHSATGGDMGLVERQIIGVCIGIAVMVLISFIPYRTILKFSSIIYIGCCALLVMVLVIGFVRGGARRWVVLPFVGQLQPSEFTKVGLVVFFASFFGRYREQMDTAKVFLMAIAFVGIPLFLILLEPDLSTSIVILVSFICMIFAAGIPYRFIGYICITVIPVVIGFLLLLKNNLLPFLSDYRINRILAWFNKDASAYTDANLQQNTSVMAIASGKLLGKGLNNVSIDSVKNGNFLAEEQTDFIFAIVGEELGFIGAVVVVILFLIIVIQCLKIGKKCADMRGKIICTGIAMLIGFQSFTNIAVATGLFPNTGLPLPFMSYGLSSLLSNYIAIGLVLNVGLTRYKPPTRRYR